MALDSVASQLGDVTFSEGDCAETSQIGDAAALKAATQLLLIAEGTFEKALLLQTLVTGRSAEVITKPRSVDKCEVSHPPPSHSQLLAVLLAGHKILSPYTCVPVPTPTPSPVPMTAAHAVLIRVCYAPATWGMCLNWGWSAGGAGRNRKGHL